jgi:hypothetical protein
MLDRLRQSPSDIFYGELVERWRQDIVDAPLRGGVSVVRDLDELEQVGFLRYDFYIARDRKNYLEADHSKRTFIQSVDRKSLNFYVAHEDRTVAISRLTKVIDAPLDLQMQLVCRAAGVCFDDPSVGIGSRMVIQETTAARIAYIRLMREMHALGLRGGITTAISYCRDHLVPLFLKFGYSRLTAVEDEVVGPLSIVRLDALDFDHFDRVRSPFAANRAIAASLGLV